MQIEWNSLGQKVFEAGISQGVLYLQANQWRGVPWNGITRVNVKSGGLEKRAYHIDGVRFRFDTIGSSFEGSIGAYTYPVEMDTHQLNGTMDMNGLIAHNQPSHPFALSWRTEIGNDSAGLGHGYKIHILYNVYATMADRDYRTINDSTEALEFEWDLTCLPVLGTKFQPTAYFSIDSRRVSPGNMQIIESSLYGSPLSEPTLLTPDQIVSILLDDNREVINSYGYGLGPYGSGFYGG